MCSCLRGHGLCLLELLDRVRGSLCDEGDLVLSQGRHIRPVHHVLPALRFWENPLNDAPVHERAQDHGLSEGDLPFRHALIPVPLILYRGQLAPLASYENPLRYPGGPGYERYDGSKHPARVYVLAAQLLDRRPTRPYPPPEAVEYSSTSVSRLSSSSEVNSASGSMSICIPLEAACQNISADPPTVLARSSMRFATLCSRGIPYTSSSTRPSAMCITRVQWTFCSLIPVPLRRTPLPEPDRSWFFSGFEKSTVYISGSPNRGSAVSDTNLDTEAARWEYTDRYIRPSGPFTRAAGDSRGPGRPRKRTPYCPIPAT